MLEIHGSKMEFGERFSYVIKDLKSYGVYEINTTALLFKHIKKTDRCVDVGAHIGYYTLIMAQRGKDVIAFEPSDYNCDLLRKNVELNNYQNVRIIQAAVSDDDRVGCLITGFECTGMNFLAGLMYDAPCAEKIAVNKLDTIFRGIDVLKIDVEGNETKVLRGLGDIRPRIIIVEDYPQLRAKRGDNPDEMYQLLKDYTCSRADNNLFCILKNGNAGNESMKETVSVGCIG